ncbi:MAG: VWA domain-containing protein [Acidobacteriota bacterium]|jgi:Ca-activated chloride channel family protein|nr:VWA domain-containing protein [Acidobacteriota bacterium]
MKIANIRRLTKVFHWLPLAFFLPLLSAQTLQVAADADNQELFSSRNVIRVNSNLVSVPVSVTNASGQGILDLRIEDFHLTEDGRAAEISRLADSSRSNLNMALLFDLSGSVSPNFEFERRAAIEFLKKIWKEGDSVSIIPFDENPDVRLENSDNLQEAMWELRQLQPTKRPTAFFDSVALATRLLQRSADEGTRQALIVISDGADNSSRLDAAAATQELQRRDTVFYAINPSGASVHLNRINIKGQENLTALAEASGGAVFVSDQAGDLEDIFGKIATELRAQYLLNYYSFSSRMDGTYHPIGVSLPEKPELRVRARPGFLAAPR